MSVIILKYVDPLKYNLYMFVYVMSAICVVIWALSAVQSLQNEFVLTTRDHWRQIYKVVSESWR